jgi:glycosyltransferase involved in cell wall biosynthesis
MPKTIYFDGLNLGLLRGTGVATYTRVLANMVQAMGNRTGILYSQDAHPPKRALDQEVAFFDAAGGRKRPLLLRIAEAMGQSGRVLSSSIGVFPYRLERHNVVLTRQFGSRFVNSDDIYTAYRVFEIAQAHFTALGVRTPVRFRQRPDLFHWTFPLPLRANARANIYTVHDLVPVRLPYTTLDWKYYYLKSMRKIAKTADHIVTVSENSKRDIMEIFGVEEKRITNTYQAVNIPAAVLNRPRDAVADELSGVFGLGHREYLLFFGSFEPKKNINRIVQAYLASKVKIPLVVVVAQSWQSDEETRLLNQILDEDRTYDRSKERRRIRRYEYMPYRLLMTLLQGARALVFPSLYEGFGLPVLEAMTLGTPVITSNTSSLPEIAGDAALSVDPYDVEAIRKAIVAVSQDGELCNGLAAKGLVQAQSFSPEAYRARIERLYASLM